MVLVTNRIPVVFIGHIKVYNGLKTQAESEVAMLSLYTNIKNERIRHNWTQKQLADLMGYANHTPISKIERGQSNIDMLTIIKFSKLFGVSPSDLLGQDGLVSEDESELFRHYNNASPDLRGAVNALLQYPRDQVSPDDADRILELYRIAPLETKNNIKLILDF